MAISCDDFLALAKTLAEGQAEIEWRNSASRTYYAAYHKSHESVDLCPDNGNIKMSSHVRLTDRFDLHNTKGSKAISYVLQTMKRVRHIADYELNEPFEKTAATAQINQYEALVDRLKSFENIYRTKTA